ncbi:MAG: lanthionine synthetase [Actinobacteria bacterium]|nr:MAG: lanthionine synthetase [Actinomycetota bacterium]
MLYDPARHEAPQAIDWDPDRAQGAIERIVRDTEAHLSERTWWPVHRRDVEPGDADVPSTTLYFGAAGVAWALDHLRAIGAARLSHDPLPHLDALLAANREWLGANGFGHESASYLMGDTPIEMMAYGRGPTEARADRLAALISGNRDHPARELMWGAPGTMLAALFLHERTGDARWAELFRDTAATLWSQLEWSADHRCRYWTQDLYGRRTTYLDGVHGFVATASPLIRGRRLLGDADWAAWQQVIAETIARTATREGSQANWRPLLDAPPPVPIVQFCHGAPGFVVCLGEMPGDELDPLLIAAGETIWAAGPLKKGSGLCHGTAGNGYAFLKLHRRTGDARWLERARAFAMHGIAQTNDEAARHGHMRHSLWTGDLGLAIYLWACLQATAEFPTLDVFYASGRPAPTGAPSAPAP